MLGTVSGTLEEGEPVNYEPKDVAVYDKVKLITNEDNEVFAAVTFVKLKPNNIFDGHLIGSYPSHLPSDLHNVSVSKIYHRYPRGAVEIKG